MPRDKTTAPVILQTELLLDRLCLKDSGLYCPILLYNGWAGNEVPGNHSEIKYGIFSFCEVNKYLN